MTTVLVVRTAPELLDTLAAERFRDGWQMQYGPEVRVLLGQRVGPECVEVRPLEDCECALCTTAVQGACQLVAIAAEGAR